jgi:two-component system response regulator YesN
LEALCSEIRDSLRRFVKISVSIGIGKPYRSWQSIRQSRHEALQALEYMLLEGKGGVFHYGQLERYYHSGDRPSAGQAPFNIDTIIRSLDDTDPVRLNRELDLFFEKIRTGAKTPELVRGLCLELIMGMVRLVREYNGDVSRIFGERLQEYETVFVKRSLDALRQRIGELSRRTAQYLSELRAARLPDVMQEVKAFIDEHYSDDISLKMISAHVYKNPAYLGQLFKATFGESFSQYVTRLRIEKAKELLRKDQLRVYEIAEKVGYVTLDTFYQRFKQMTGMNPTEYKHKISS